MNSERDELAAVIESAKRRDGFGSYIRPEQAADAILAAGYSRPKQVSTVAELDALPTESLVRSEQGGVWHKEASGSGCVWTEPGAQWWHWATDIALPAMVLYSPVVGK